MLLIDAPKSLNCSKAEEFWLPQIWFVSDGPKRKKNKNCVRLIVEVCDSGCVGPIWSQKWNRLWHLVSQVGKSWFWWTCSQSSLSPGQNLTRAAASQNILLWYSNMHTTYMLHKDADLPNPMQHNIPQEYHFKIFQSPLYVCLVHEVL